MFPLLHVYCVLSFASAFDFTPVDEAVEAALKRGDCPGAVVIVLHKDQVVLRKAYGHRSIEPEKSPMTADAIFDLASLTKPIATATSIMLLIEQGKLHTDDKVAKHWPAFAANGKGDVSIAQLLLHTSGLTADNAIADYADGRAKALERIAALKLEVPPGTRFKYSDVGFIVLGELVEKISGLPIDRFAKKNIFEPLKMTDSGFNPPEELRQRIAPTGQREGRTILGEVHDPRSFKMGGVAGHAGLFASGDDLARYCRMILRKGELDGTRILKPETIKLFTEAHDIPAGGKPGTSPRKLFRSYGWDVDTAYSGQRGDGFRRGEGFGHTGFTGTSIWIDPQTQTAIIILTNRVHPADKGNVSRLRREIATAAAKIIGASVK
ncbi:MAG TPA: serine hydrolase domain-containing protein [Urbifossiella sp.]